MTTPPVLPTRPVNSEGTTLTDADPVARLSRPQSGIGAITTALRAGGLPVRLGALWQSTDGHSGQLTAGSIPAGPRWTVPGDEEPRPVLVAAGENLMVLDCRQIRRLHRVCLYARAGATVDWAGTLTVSTSGGSTAVVPLQAPPSAGAMPLATLVVVDGYLYVRAERRWPVATVRDLAHEFGFTRLTWADPDTTT